MAKGAQAGAFPRRGTPGGWRDPWDGDAAALVRAQAEAAERRLSEAAARVGAAMRAEEAVALNVGPSSRPPTGW